MAYAVTRGRPLRRWWLAVLVVLVAPPGLAASSSASGERDGEASAFECHGLAEREAPESAADWFERSLWANHCYVFQARAVRIASDGVRTLALSHGIQDGVEREVARFLDGPPVIFERRGRIGRGGWAREGDDALASPTSIMSHLGEHYRLTLDGEERIAGRSSMRLNIEPLDELRYGHRVWLDQTTALPLKQVMLDEEGRALETFQITELDNPRLYEGRVVLDSRRQPPSDPWHPGWLPPGYVAQPVATSSSLHDAKVEHRLFSDGLSSLSLFVEPLDGEGPVLAPGMHRLGISYAAVRHLELGGTPMQVVAMGELPPKVLLRVVEKVEWRSERAASDAEAGPASEGKGS